MNRLALNALLPLACCMALSLSCSKDRIMSEQPQSCISINLADLGADRPADSGSEENRIDNMTAYLFKDGLLADIKEVLSNDGHTYNVTLNGNGRVYVLANAAGAISAEIGTGESSWREAVITSEDGAPVNFLTGMAEIGEYSSRIPVSLRHGRARLDLAVEPSDGSVSVSSITIRNVLTQSYIIPGQGMFTPQNAPCTDMTIPFHGNTGSNHKGIAYLYEQSNDRLDITVTAEVDGQPCTMDARLPQTIKRNTVYAIRIFKNALTVGIEIEEWNSGQDTSIKPDFGSVISVNADNSDIPQGVSIEDGGKTLRFNHMAHDFTFELNCSAQLEPLGNGNGYIQVEDSGEGWNRFRITKRLFSPDMEASSLTLGFHRKGLDNSFPADTIRFVFGRNPVVSGKRLPFGDNSYRHDFGGWAENEIETFEVPQDKDIRVEFDQGEDPWLQLSESEENPRRFRLIAGWKPNDPTASGRTQDARVVIIDKADPSQREEYVISRINYGLPVTWLHGTWWCKYNAIGNSRSFKDQILCSEDPAAKAGKTVMEYLRDCTPEEFYRLWGWAYQGDSGIGMRVIEKDNIAVLEGFTTNVTVHMNRLPPQTLAPAGYEVPSMEDFNYIFDATDYVWVMWNGTHTLRNPWEGHSQIRRVQQRRNDLRIGSLEIRDIISVAMNSPDFPSHEALVWYGPAAQWNDSGIQHGGHYNNILFTVYSPEGSGWYFNGSMAGLYLSRNGAGTKDTRILRFKKSPVEYIY